MYKSEKVSPKLATSTCTDSNTLTEDCTDGRISTSYDNIAYPYSITYEGFPDYIDGWSINTDAKIDSMPINACKLGTIFTNIELYIANTDDYGYYLYIPDINKGINIFIKFDKIKFTKIEGSLFNFIIGTGELDDIVNAVKNIEKDKNYKIVKSMDDYIEQIAMEKLNK